MRRITWPIWFRLTLVLLAACLAAQPALGQKKKKDNKDAAKEAAAKEKEDNAPVIPLQQLSDNEQIDRALNEIIAGWQIGETELMQKHYSPDAIFVSGAFEPPVIGWTNYLQVYQAQRQRMSNVTMERSNTLIRVKGTSAVANYQWRFSASVDGNSMWARGHSTLVWEKREGHWVVLHNHTSLVDQGVPKPPATPAGVPAPAPAKPPSPSR